MSRLPLSVVVITLNAAKDIGRCMESARAIADEIVVVDSGSTDDTVAIATRLGARVIHQDWLGYGPQKQFAVAQAQHDWILSLDADEALTPELADSIESALVEPTAQAYMLARCNRFMGRWLRHGEGYPDWCMRLFNCHHARWSDDVVHEHVQVSGSQAKLSGDLLHYSEQGLADYLDKQNRYTTLQAQCLADSNKKFGLPHMVFSPMIRFIKFYFLRCGFLDGLPGLVHVLIGCWNSFTKYAKLRELHDLRKMTE